MKIPFLLRRNQTTFSVVFLNSTEKLLCFAEPPKKRKVNTLEKFFSKKQKTDSTVEEGFSGPKTKGEGSEEDANRGKPTTS